MPGMPFTLQILHGSDFEAATAALDRAKNFAAIVDKLSTQQTNSITLAAGDDFIPGPFNAAEGDASIKAALQNYEAGVLGVPAGSLTGITPAAGRVDIAILNAIGVQADVTGNHDWDFGPATLAGAIGFTKSATTATSTPAQLAASVQFTGAQFPFVDDNLDFSGDPSTNALYGTTLRDASSYATKPSDLASNAALTVAATDKEIAPSTIVTVNGEKIGIVGVTTQLLASISSPGAVKVLDPAGDGGVDNMAELAGLIQPYVDQLTAAGVDKIVAVTHLQQYQNEFALAGLLKNVDVIVAGGSHAVFDNPGFAVRPGDVVQQPYPVIRTGADGNPVAIVVTGNEFSYVGRLVVTFDAQGHVVPGSINPTVSGDYVTTDAQVQSLYGSADPFAAGSRGATVKALTDAVGAVVGAKDGNVYGYSKVFLSGQGAQTRTQETNLGDLSADANLYVARLLDPTVTVSVKNGGGIRADIGAYSNGAVSTPITTVANPATGKPMGGVSQLDDENALRFNNNLSIVTVNAKQFDQLFEFYAQLQQPGKTPGGYGQIGGVAYSYDLTGTAQVLNADGSVATAGSRVKTLAILNDDGSVKDVVVQNGALVGDAARAIRVVTLDFIAGGGDANPLGVYGTNRVNLLNNAALPDNLVSGPTKGSEQWGFAAYTKAKFGDTGFAYAQAETAAAGDNRIENLALRADGVLQKTTTVAGGSVTGTDAGDLLIGSAGTETFRVSGGRDTIHGNGGADTVDFATLGRNHGGLARDVGGPINAYTWVDAKGNSDTTHWDGVRTAQFADSQVQYDIRGTGAEVSMLYADLIGRPADAAGMAFWADALAHGASVRDVAVGMLGTTEAAATQALSNAAFVAKLYTAEFGRAGEAGGIAFWTGRLDAGAGRADVATAFVTSAEVAADPLKLAANGVVVGDQAALQVGHAYQAVLGRNADPGGLAAYKGLIAAGGAEPAVVQSLANSVEFTAKYGSASNADFLTALYQTHFGHDADDAGRAFWTAQLTAGATKAQLEVAFDTSAEGLFNYTKVAATGLDLI